MTKVPTASAPTVPVATAHPEIVPRAATGRLAISHAAIGLSATNLAVIVPMVTSPVARGQRAVTVLVRSLLAAKPAPNVLAVIARLVIALRAATGPSAISLAAIVPMVTSPVAIAHMPTAVLASRVKSARAPELSMVSSARSAPVVTVQSAIARKVNVPRVIGPAASPSARSRAAASRLAVSRVENPAVRVGSQASPAAQVARLAVQPAVVPLVAAPAGAAPEAERADAR